MDGQGEFRIASWDEVVAQEYAPAGRISRAVVSVVYSGAIVGEGRIEYVMAYRGDGVARFTGYERIAGAIGAREGSCILEHRGTFESGVAASRWTIVPGSGTEGWVGLEGTGEFASREHGRADYSFQLR